MSWSDMVWSDTAFFALVLLALLVWVVWVSASRLDRLHRKVGASRSVVEAQLVRRATVAAELATSGLLDPPSSVLVGEAAWEALLTQVTDELGPDLLPSDLRALLDAGTATSARVGWDVRARIESGLSATLREVLMDPDEVAALREDVVGDALLEELGSAWYRVELARRFHNEAVAQTQRVRRGLLVRLLRLAGHAPEPRTLDLDDAWPDALGRPGVRA
jgi:hypothetical protein